MKALSHLLLTYYLSHTSGIALVLTHIYRGIICIGVSILMYIGVFTHIYGIIYRGIYSYIWYHIYRGIHTHVYRGIHIYMVSYI